MCKTKGCKCNGECVVCNCEKERNEDEKEE